MATQCDAPVDLRCEFQDAPLGVDVTRPRLSWRSPAARPGWRQSAYQIVVRSPHGADSVVVWDSGKVDCSASINVEYGGPTARPRQRFEWTVRVWDDQDEMSAWGEPSSWEAGQLVNRSWCANWVSAPRSSRLQPPVAATCDRDTDWLTPPTHFRSAFQVSDRVASARVYATARGIYALHLNGQRVGDQVLAPGWTDYRQRQQYQIFDVTDQLVLGKNVLGAIVGDGWYCGYVGNDAKRRGRHYGDQVELLVELRVQLVDGSEIVVPTDGAWQHSRGPIDYSDLLMGERFDARLRIDGWDTADYDATAWEAVSVGTGVGSVRLVAEPAPPIRVVESLPALEVVELSNGDFVVDFGQNHSGWVRLAASGEPGTTVRIAHGERLNPDGSIYLENLGSARATDLFVLSGHGREVFEPTFTQHGYQYVQVSGYPGTLRPEDVVSRVVHSDVSSLGSFECSDERINRFVENIDWTVRSNLMSVITCDPQRDERLGWLGDAQFTAMVSNFSRDLSAFNTKWVADIADAQHPNGAFPDVAPRIVYDNEGAPAWGDGGIIIPWVQYRFYGDARMIAEHWRPMTRWMEYIRSSNPDLIRRHRLNANFGDWLAPEGDSTPPELIATAYWAWLAQLMAELAPAAGRPDEAKGYHALAEMIRAAFVREFISEDGRVSSGTQTAYSLAFRMDLLPRWLRSSAAGHFRSAVEAAGNRLTTGFVGTSVILPALVAAGLTDVAYGLLLERRYPSWGYAIDRGATTVWERWDSFTDDNGFGSPQMNSFNLLALGSAGEWLYRYVGGIDTHPSGPGFTNAFIHPTPGPGMEWARTEYRTPLGPIRTEWHQADGQLDLVLTLPANMTADVHVPSTHPDLVRLVDGTAVAVSATSPAGVATYQAGAGTHRFVAPWKSSG